MGLATLRRYGALDAVFSREADETFPEFCATVLGGHALPPTNGVFIKGADPRLSIPSRLSGRLVRHLDENPNPEFDDYFSELAAPQFETKLRTSGFPSRQAAAAGGDRGVTAPSAG